MKKSAIIKIVSIVLVLCTLITLCIIPVGAVDTSNADLSSFLFHYGIEKVATRNIKSDGTSEVISSDSNFRMIVDETIKHGIIISPIVDTYFDLVSYQSFIMHRSLNNGDIVTFSLSFLSPWCEDMALFIYFEDGTRRQYSFRRSDEKVFTKNKYVVDYSGESLAYDSRVYCHRYTLDVSFGSDGNDIIATQIQVKYSTVNKVNKTWLFYEDCSYYVDRNDSNTGFLGVLSNIGNWIKESFSATKEFFLNFGSKIRDSVSPFFDKVGTWISNSASTTWNNFKTTLVNIKDGIINLPSNIKVFFTSLGDRISGFFDGISEGIYNWFSETFLGKVLRITNKSKAFISQAGNDVQYAALDDEVGESTEEAAPDDWDMIHRPSFEIDIEYYNNLYPNVFDTGG